MGKRSDSQIYMLSRLFFLFTTVGLSLGLTGAVAMAGVVTLQVGQSYTCEDVEITCTDKANTLEPIVLTECQMWDEFNKKCLYEKKIHSLGRAQCLEECQQWDKFNKVCLYETRCRFYPEHRTFVRTRCKEFDSFTNTCVLEEEVKLSGR